MTIFDLYSTFIDVDDDTIVYVIDIITEEVYFCDRYRYVPLSMLETKIEAFSTSRVSQSDGRIESMKIYVK